MVKFIAGVAGICALATSGRAIAAPVTYTINSALSSLQVSVASQGTPLTYAQFTGSDTASLSGALGVDTTGGNISISSAPGSIAFSSQSGIYPDAAGGNPANGTTSPLPDLAPNDPNVGNTQTANYGLVLVVPADPTDPTQIYNLNTAAIAGYAAIDSALASLNGMSVLTGGTFDTTGLTVSTDAGNLDYNLNAGNGDFNPPDQNFQTGTAFQNGTTGIGGNSGNIAGAANGTIVTAGGISTLTIPVFVDVVVNTGLLVVDAIFSGQIVATAVVPEPSSFALAGLGLIALVPAVRRRLRKA
ncbi:MAG TPA: PEP-CTERM sorting domain-containing protein [Pirellulales bacterium]|jgi:hypothetical protein